MTDKELHKLSRRELLQLMLAQGREAEKAKQELAETQEELKQLEEGYERLKRRLDDKDAQIHKLRAALQSVQDDPGALSGAAPVAMPVPDDYYAPPPEQQAARPAQQPVMPAQQPVRQAQQAPRHAAANPNNPPAHAKPEIPPTPRHSRKEQEYYDYLFGPVQGQGQQAQPPPKERPRPQPQPVRAPQQVPAEPRAKYGQWSQPQYMREPQPGYYSPSAQYIQQVYQYEREPQPPPAPVAPEQIYPPQMTDEFIPEPDTPAETMQMLSVVEIVNGMPVSKNQVLRPKC